MTSDTGAGFGVYIHWPFCESKCPYCDFNSHVADGVDQGRWLNAFHTELEYSAQELLQQYQETGQEPAIVTSIFFGGGTPSLMKPETVSGIIDAIHSSFSIAEGAEITIEANPSSAEADRFRGYAGAGVNRASIGVQSLHDHDLMSLGRAHNRDAALETIATARSVFSRYSFDLIYARPGQSIKDWETELTDALDLAGDHLSVYQLTIEPGTAFARDRVPAADEETAEAMYRITQEILMAAGLPAYEVSNHATPGMEGQHNLTYWRGGAYLGIGPGAHSRLKDNQGWRSLYRQYQPSRWLEGVENGGHGTAKMFRLSEKERRDEVLMMGLRLVDGISDRDFKAATGMSLKSAVDVDSLFRMINGGFVEMDTDVLRATPAGLLRLDAVLAALLAD